MNRLIAALILILLTPFLLIILAWVWVVDCHFPIYISTRIGRFGRPFQLWKIRTMRISNETSQFMTASSNPRITALGHVLRRFKVDEWLQLVNIVRGKMNFFGPRPDVFLGGISLYEPQDMPILSVKPGLVDLASLVFVQEDSILGHAQDPDALCFSEIFPLKRELMLAYVQNRSMSTHMRLLKLSISYFFTPKKFQQGVENLLKDWNIPRFLRQKSMNFLKSTEEEKAA